MLEQTQEITDIIMKAAEKARQETSDEPEPGLTGDRVEWPVTCKVNPGLDGAIAAETMVGYVNGVKGWLIYRGYDIFELTGRCTYEEVVFLLLYGHLPTQGELDAFKDKLRTYQKIDSTLHYLKANPIKELKPMAALALGTTLLRHEGKLEEDIQDSIRLIAAFPVMLGAIARIRAGHEPLAPRDDLSYAGNLLYMMTGNEPDAKQERLMDVGLTLHADHGSNASTFTGMVVASTLSDMYFSVTSAIGSLAGPLHGGANEAVLGQLQEIKSADRVTEWYHHARADKKRIMGFGHRVYKAYDPRARVMGPLAEYLVNESSDGMVRELYAIAKALEDTVVENLGRKKGVFPNVDFFSGIVYNCMGITSEYFTPLFAAARVSGWTSRILEYTEDNRLFRPRAVYVGSIKNDFKPIHER